MNKDVLAILTQIAKSQEETVRQLKLLNKALIPNDEPLRVSDILGKNQQEVEAMSKVKGGHLFRKRQSGF